jgi:hypothetical protein
MKKSKSKLSEIRKKQKIYLCITGIVFIIAALFLSSGIISGRNDLYTYLKLFTATGFLFIALYLFTQKINDADLNPGEKGRVFLTPLNRIIGKADSGFTGLNGYRLEIETGLKKYRHLINEKELNGILNYFGNYSIDIPVENPLSGLSQKAA